MSISIKDFNHTNYDSLQRIFMNIPFKEYISYIYPRTGCAHILPEAMHFLTEVCRCNESYYIDFGMKKTDDTMTVGQLLRIAAGALDSEAEEAYFEYDINKIVSLGVKIVELLILIPFGRLTDSSYQYDKIKTIKESECFIRDSRNYKETINNG